MTIPRIATGLILLTTQKHIDLKGMGAGLSYSAAVEI